MHPYNRGSSKISGADTGRYKMIRAENLKVKALPPAAAPLLIALILVLALAAACQGEPTATPAQERTATAPTSPPEPTPTPTVEPAPTEQSTPLPTPAPVPTDNPADTSKEAPLEPTEQAADGHGLQTEDSTTAPAMTALTPEQEDCLPEEVQGSRSILDVMDPRDAGLMAQAVACLTDEDITRFLILPGITPGGSLTKEQADCIIQPGTGAMIRSSLSLSGDHVALDAALFTIVAQFTHTAAACVPEAEFEDLFLPGTPLDRLTCIIPTIERATALFAEILETGDEPLDLAIAEAHSCLLQYPPEQLIEPLPHCTDEERESGVPCPVN